MNSCFIILAGGESKRFNSNIPKPYTNYRGKPLLLHSIDKAKVFNKFNKIVLVVNKKHKNFIKKLNIKNIKIITGGKTRAEAMTYLDSQMSKKVKSKINLTAKTASISISPKKAGISVDLEATIEKAPERTVNPVNLFSFLTSDSTMANFLFLIKSDSVAPISDL